MKLELWLHTPTGDRYIVLSNEAGVQMAARLMDGTDMRLAQLDESTIPWMPGLGDWVQARRPEFECVFPQSRA
jgi:hypothetical protein